MGLTDSRGVALSTSDVDSLVSHENALAMMMGFRGDPMAAIDDALARDPDFVTGHCLRAGLLVMAGNVPADRQLAEAIAAVDARHDRANERELRHIAAARAWLERDARRAARLYGDIVIDYPRDILALLLAHSFDFHLGRREMLRDRVAQVLPHWDSGTPGYDGVLTMYAFGLEENADYDGAEATARAALAHAPANPAAVHVVAHVMEMRGRPAEGIAWLEATAPAWAEGTAFSVHNAWHLALCHVDLDQPAKALGIYDARIASQLGKATSALVDASALLWRLSLRGVDVRPRWSTVADAWKAKVFDQHRVFSHAHAMMALAATGRDADASRLLRTLRAGETVGANSREDSRLAVPVCEAFLAFGHGDYGVAVERLNLVRHLAHRCGGSIAQCDLIHLTLVEAALRGRKAGLARALTAERTARRPGSRLNAWLAARANAVLVPAT